MFEELHDGTVVVFVGSGGLGSVISSVGSVLI